VRDSGAKEILKKQLQGLTDGLPEQMDLATGRLTSKKPKKEKSPEEACQKAPWLYSLCLKVEVPQALHFFTENKRLGALQF
jgi:hypothetical protein